ncbi:MAG: outer membrane protein assembly factor BamD [Bacteroidia bacterium]|nr:outer membrane protein assembly factor BamD [Bacteroidia bacterium]
MAKYFYLLFFIVASTFGGCSKYSKILKSSNYELKYNYACQYYEKQSYSKALPLLEELLTIFKGTEKGEKIYYYYCKTNYELGDYILAGYHCKIFARNYPNNEHAEECAYLHAYCFYLDSPKYSLDQTNTLAAIEEMQVFINEHPNSTRVAQANEIIDKLRYKIATKQYEAARHYYFVENYKAAIVAFENVIKDNPSTPYREKTMVAIIKSYYLLAEQSIDLKKAERYQLSIDNYYKFVDAFPISEQLKECESIYNKCVKQKQKSQQI